MPEIQRLALPVADVHPTDVARQGYQVLLRHEVVIGRHEDPLAVREVAADWMIAYALDLAVVDPTAQLLVATHQIAEVVAPPSRDIALE